MQNPEGHEHSIVDGLYSNSINTSAKDEKPSGRPNAGNIGCCGRGSGSPFHGCGPQEAVVRCPYHKTLICSMSLFGLFYPRNFTEFGKGFRIAMMVYSIGVAMFIVLNTLRVFVTIFDPMDNIGVTFNKINYAAWLLLCSFNVCVFGWMSFTRKNGIKSYYTKAKRTFERMDEVGIHVTRWKSWKVELPCLAIGWLLVIANSVIVGRRLFDQEKAEESEWLCRLVPPSNGTKLSQLLDDQHGLRVMSYAMTVAVALASGAWIWPVVYIINIAARLTLAFKCLNRRMRKLVACDCVSFLREIGLYRQVHWEIRKCVDIADKHFRYVLGVHIVLYLLLSMMEIYNLAQFKALRDSRNADLLAAYIIWLISALVMLAAECAASSFVAHESLETAKPLFKLADRCGNLDNDQLFQVQLFLNQLQNPSGFKVMGLFVLSKEGLLAIVGTWVTYFLIVLQFAPPQHSY